MSMRSPIIDKMVRSGLFPDESSAAYAIAMFDNLSQPGAGPLINASNGKEYTTENFNELLLEHCRVKKENIDKARRVLKLYSMTV